MEKLAKNLRPLLRWFHIGVGIFIGAYFYSPLSNFPWALALIKFALIPLLVLSGIAMWKQAQVMRLLRGKSAG